MEKVTGVPAKDIRGAARLYATGGNGAIYYGLGVTEHSQGSTVVLGMANLAMATGNLGRNGVGVNPLRGQNNVQGSCDMGSFPHEYTGYRHISEEGPRKLFEKDWGVTLDPEPGLRIPNMFDRPSTAPSWAFTSQGEDIAQSDPNTHHVTAALSAMECIRRARSLPERDRGLCACVLPGRILPGEGRHLHQCGAAHRARAEGDPADVRHGRMGSDRQAVHRARLSDALQPPSEIMDEIARLTPTFAGVSYAKLDELGSVQWPCNEKAPEGTPVMHIGGFARGKGKFVLTEYVPTDERTGPRFPLLLTTGRILSQYNVGAQTRRTANNVWHDEDVLEIHPHDAENRGIREGDRVALVSRAGDTSMRAHITERVQPGVVYTTFHHPESGANVITTDYSDWATNCPEYKVTAVEVRLTNHESRWQEDYEQLQKAQRIETVAAE